jgi:hypothetical protein
MESSYFLMRFDRTINIYIRINLAKIKKQNMYQKLRLQNLKI